MSYLAGIIVSCIFTALSGIHVYWALGGQKWAHIVLPQAKTESSPVFTPGMGATLTVATGLLGMAAISLAFAYYKSAGSIPKALNIASWGILFIFLARSIGDFKYVGFFKRITGTSFAHYDTILFTPICLTIVILMAVLIKS